MSDKTLLNEGTIRRFMKLAEIEPLASPFIERLDEEVELALEQDEMEDEGEEGMPDLDMGAGGEDMEMDLGGEEDMEMDLGDEEDLDMEEPDMDMEGEEDPMETLADEIKQSVMDTLEDMIDDGTLEFMKGEEEEEELDLEDDEDDLELDAAEDEGLEDDELEDPGAELEDEGEPEELEELGGYPEDPVEEAHVVAEVARRVTKRILSSR